jgi:polyisoprenoid-binding protein YceI
MPNMREQLRVLGDLTIRGVTRDVVLDVEDAGQTKDPGGKVRAAGASQGFAAREPLANQ